MRSERVELASVDDAKFETLLREYDGVENALVLRFFFSFMTMSLYYAFDIFLLIFLKTGNAESAEYGDEIFCKFLYRLILWARSSETREHYFLLLLLH